MANTIIQYQCPVCKHIQTTDFIKCPACGVEIKGRYISGENKKHYKFIRRDDCLPYIGTAAIIRDLR